MMVLLDVCGGWGLIGCAAKATGAATKAAAKTVNNAALNDLKDSMLQTVDNFAASLGTMWMKVPTPVLTGNSTGGVAAGAASSGGVEQLLGYMMWIGSGIAVLSLIALGAMLGRGSRDASRHVSRIAVVLMGTLLMGAASAITGALLPQRSVHAAPAVAMIHNSLWWYAAALVVASIIYAGIQMVWTQRAEPGKDLIRSLLQMIVVSAGAATIVGLLVAAGDSLANFILKAALTCDPGSDGACFGSNVNKLLLVSFMTGPQAPGVMSVLGLAALSALVAGLQCIVMLARGAMLIILVGLLPTSAAATNTVMGREWFRKLTGWLLAFALYKPAAAVIYAVAFKLSGSKLTASDATGISSVLMGIVMMTLALLALPALIKLAVPQAGVLAGGGNGLAGAGMGAVLMALPTGAGGGRSTTTSRSQIQVSRNGSSQNSHTSPSGSRESVGRHQPAGAGAVPQIAAATNEAVHRVTAETTGPAGSGESPTKGDDR